MQHSCKVAQNYALRLPRMPSRRGRQCCRARYRSAAYKNVAAKSGKVEMRRQFVLLPFPRQVLARMPTVRYAQYRPARAARRTKVVCACVRLVKILVVAE